jgi:hypothetical protein
VSRTISGTSLRSGPPCVTRAPAARKMPTARSKTARTSSSMAIIPPRSVVHAMRQPLTEGALTARTNSVVSTSYARGERASSPAITDSINAASATVRAMGPSTE